MKQTPYLLFDAGGTLVFPHQEFLFSLAKKYLDGQVTLEGLFALHCKMIYEVDVHVRKVGWLENIWPDGYAAALFTRLGLPKDQVAEAASAARQFDQEHNLWGFTYPWVYDVLAALAGQGYRMSVISNADGRVEQMLIRLGLRPFFAQVFDSALVGVEKPDPRIFHHALDTLALDPAEAIYIGDVYMIDVAGANHAGMEAIHLDPLGLYAEWPGVHLPDIRALPGWLSQQKRGKM